MVAIDAQDMVALVGTHMDLLMTMGNTPMTPGETITEGEFSAVEAFAVGEEEGRSSVTTRTPTMIRLY